MSDIIESILKMYDIQDRHRLCKGNKQQKRALHRRVKRAEREVALRYAAANFLPLPTTRRQFIELVRQARYNSKLPR